MILSLIVLTCFSVAIYRSKRPFIGCFNAGNVLFQPITLPTTFFTLAILVTLITGAGNKGLVLFGTLGIFTIVFSIWRFKKQPYYIYDGKGTDLVEGEIYYAKALHNRTLVPRETVYFRFIKNNFYKTGAEPSSTIECLNATGAEIRREPLTVSLEALLLYGVHKTIPKKS